MNELKKYIIRLEELEYLDNLTPFQVAFLKDIHFFVRNCGQYIFISKYVINKYKNILSGQEILKEIKDIKIKYLLISSKKTIYNGEFVTKILINLNYEHINTILENNK